MLDVKSKLAAHAQHGGVLAQHLTFDALEFFAPAVFDDQFHELPSEPEAFEVATQQDRVFARLVVSVGMQAHNAKQFITALINGYERHRARVVDLRQAGDERVAQGAQRRKEPQSYVFSGYVLKEPWIQGFIFRAHGPHQDALAVGEREVALPFGRVRSHRKTGMTRPFGFRLDRGDPDHRARSVHFRRPVAD